MKTQRRRRREGKTDYKARFNLLKSGKPRLIVRKSNRYIIAQLVDSEIAQDKVLVQVSSKELLENGWPKEKSGSLKSLHACYLVGYMLAKKILGKENEVILDAGLQRNVKGGRIYAVVKGAVDGGLKIPHSKESLPTTEKLNENKNLFNLLERIKEKL